MADRNRREQLTKLIKTTRDLINDPGMTIGSAKKIMMFQLSMIEELNIRIQELEREIGLSDSFVTDSGSVRPLEKI